MFKLKNLIYNLTFIFIISLMQTYTAQAKEYQAIVLYNHNGDTITAKVNDKKERIRLIGIEAQKIGKGPLAEEAQLFLEKLTKGKNVKLETDTKERDQFGRLLAYVFIDGKMINQEIVREGFANIFPVAPNVKYLDVLGKAQKEARDAGKGIWFQPSINGNNNSPDKITRKVKTMKGFKQIGTQKVVHINEWSKTYHLSGCPNYNCKSCTIEMTEERALIKGFHKCSMEVKRDKDIVLKKK